MIIKKVENIVYHTDEFLYPFDNSIHTHCSKQLFVYFGR